MYKQVTLETNLKMAQKFPIKEKMTINGKDRKVVGQDGGITLTRHRGGFIIIKVHCSRK